LRLYRFRNAEVMGVEPVRCSTTGEAPSTERVSRPETNIFRFDRSTQHAPAGISGRAA
jgi:hypothetical protein